MNRRSFLSVLGAYLGAAALPTVAKAEPTLLQGGDIWLSVSFEDYNPEKMRAAMMLLAERIKEIDAKKYRFVEMAHPRGVELVETKRVKGIPIRHIRCFDLVKDWHINRLDVFARAI